MRQWYRIKAKADESIAELFIYDDIGKSYWDDETVTAKRFIDDLRSLPATVTTLHLHVNSGGGDPFDATAIANALRAERLGGRTVETFVDGLAASAASIPIMAGSAIHMSDNALIMIHDPWAVIIGNAAEMRQFADELDKTRDAIVATYKWHSTLGDDELRALMAATTWMDADEAIANGFATDKVEGLDVAASLDARVLAKLTVPEKFRARVNALVKPMPEPPPAPTPATATDVLAACADAGLDLAFAQTLIAGNHTSADVKAKVTAEKTKRTDATARATQITALCAKAKLPERADLYIKSALSIDEIKSDLTVLTGKLDKLEIDGTLPADLGGRKTIQISARKIYEERNRPSATKKE